MCGDLEGPDGEAERLYDHFLQAAEEAIHEAIDHRGGSRRRIEQQSESGDHLPDTALHAYMDGLFADILSACLKDARKTSSAERYRAFASQSIVLARLAGFLAGYRDPHEDPLASAIEALMAGYSQRSSAHSHD